MSPQPAIISDRRLPASEEAARGDIAFVDARGNRIRYPYHSPYPPVRIVRSSELEALDEEVASPEDSDSASEGNSTNRETASPSLPPIVSEASPASDLNPQVGSLSEHESVPGFQAMPSWLNSDFESDSESGNNPDAGATLVDGTLSFDPYDAIYNVHYSQPDDTESYNPTATALQVGDNLSFDPLNSDYDNNFSQLDDAGINNATATVPQVAENLLLTQDYSPLGGADSIHPLVATTEVEYNHLLNTTTPYYANHQIATDLFPGVVAPSRNLTFEQTLHEDFSNVPTPDPEDVLSWDNLLHMATSSTQQPRDPVFDDEVKTEDFEDL